MINKIVSIGDSFLAGAELTYPLPDTEHTAPALLAKKYKKEFRNFAYSGVGIQLIIHVLLENIENKNIDGNTLVVCGIPPIGRIDFIPKIISDKFRPTLDYSFFISLEEGKFNLNRITPDFNNMIQLHQNLRTNVDFYRMGELHYISNFFT
jgi:hypothetical protein